MSVHLPAGVADYLKRTSSFLNPAADSTVMLWARFDTMPIGPDYSTAYLLVDNPAIYTDYVGIFSNTTLLDLDAGGTIITSMPFPTAATWYHLTWVQSGTTQRFYVNGVLIGSGVKNRAAFVIGFELLGNDTFSSGDITMAYFRSWQVPLSGSSVRAEMLSPTIITASPFMNTPLILNGLDISGNGRNWTSVGTPTFNGLSDPFAANSSVGTAISLGTLPATETIDKTTIGDHWYSYNVRTDEVCLGVWAFASTSGADTANMQLLVSGSLADVDFEFGIESVPIVVPVTAGTTVSFNVQITNSGMITDTTLSVLTAPQQDVPAGSIYTNDDTSQFRIGVISPTDGDNYNILRYFPGPPTNSERGGDILANGTFLMANDDTTAYEVYTPQLVLSATVAALVSTQESSVRTCIATQHWFVGENASIHKVDSTGTVLQTWTGVGITNLAVAAKNDESVVYVANVSTANVPVRRWITASSTYGTDIRAAAANIRIIDVLVTGNDDVVIMTHSSVTGLATIYRYNAAGTLLNTYAIVPTVSHDGSLFHAIDDPNSFWTRVHDTTKPTSPSTFYNIHISDGAILATIIQTTYEFGAYDGGVTATPTSRFGLSTSCPSFILRAAIAPPVVNPMTQEYLIRRERWFPVLNQEQMRMMFKLLQIDLQAGNGLTTGQGEDPLLELDWSDDGGWTWSNLHFLPTGRRGQYNRRAIARMLGQSRQRVFRIAVSDQVQWVIVDGYMQVVQGLS